MPVPLPSTTKFNFGEWQPQTYDGQVEVQLGERRVELLVLVSALAGDYYDEKNVDNLKIILKHYARGFNQPSKKKKITSFLV